MHNILLIVLVVILVIILLCRKCSSKSDNYNGVPHYSTYLTTVGHPRFPGDYMAYEGEVPTGGGGYELESDIGYGGDNSYVDVNLCQECMENCVGLAIISGQTGNSLRSAKQICKIKCDGECNPITGL